MTICLDFDLLAGIPQLSDDPAAIWRSCSLFVKRNVPRVGLPDEPHGHLGINVLEVPVPFFQPSTSSLPMVKAGQVTVNSRLFNGDCELLGHVILNGDLSMFYRWQGTWSNMGFITHDDRTTKLVHAAVMCQGTINTHDCLLFFC
jgi:hypothetical protein